MRDFDAEAAANALLDQLGVKRDQASYWEPEPVRGFAASKLPRVVRSLVEAGWHIDAEGKIFRRPGSYRLEVSSGMDWFELHGEVDYGEHNARLPELLAALRRGDNMVQLDDGTYGMLPEEWLRRFGPLAGMGAPENGHIRFTRSQAGLLDALLAAQPEARWDETFARVRGRSAPIQCGGDHCTACGIRGPFARLSVRRVGVDAFSATILFRRLPGR